MNKTKMDINSDAIALRTKFGKDPFSPIDVFALLNSSDSITVVFYPMSPNISGMCIRDTNIKLIAINSTLSYGRQRFTAAHELCHLFYHEELKSIVCAKDLDSTKKTEIEKEADTFASFFLAPYESLREYIRHEILENSRALDLRSVIKIEQHFGLSHQAILWRLILDGYISQDDAASMKSSVTQSAIRMGFDDMLYRPTPIEKQYLTLGSYIKMAEDLKEKALISNGKYEELLLTAFRADIVYGLSSEGEFSDD